ncbi:MAG: hypothetical protein R2684_02645 [Pyrinomonadaceae bacterium]
MSNQPTVAGLFNRALEIRAGNESMAYSDIAKQLVSENSGSAFPNPAFMAIPELDAIAPEEDWSAGLPIVLRGIQNEDWNEIVHGVIISLEQVENYPKESGREDAPEKEWRNRNKNISEANQKNYEKWMPEELMDLAKKSVSG